MKRGMLLEIGTEEIPARFVPQALEEMKVILRRELEVQRVEGGEMSVMGTPRRLTLCAELEEHQRPLKNERIGPPMSAAFDPQGRPTKAAEGFARREGVRVEDLEVIETEKGKYLCARRQERGRPTREVLTEVLPRLITSLPFPKSMRWSDSELQFARPIHWIVALFDGEVIPFKLGELQSDRYTRGHRFLSPDSIEVKGKTMQGQGKLVGYIRYWNLCKKVGIVKYKPATLFYFEYLYKLFQASVIVDPEVRTALIRRSIEEAADQVGGRPMEDEILLEEVTYLVEYPVAILGVFDRAYLELPREVLISAMQHHQRYFPVVDNTGALLPYFVAVSNTAAHDMGVVKAGNERVLRARLADAQFFFQEDQKVSLEERVNQLKGVIFQAKLGTSYEKVMRFQELAVRLADVLAPEQREVVSRGAYLCKADLVTEMVGEFPQLQGVMGREYALLGGEDPAVAQVIYEHYLPRFSGDELPTSAAGDLVSIADKLDTIIGCFGVGLVPTGTSDPFALRRQALGIIHIILGKGYHLSLHALTRIGLEQLTTKLERPSDEVEAEVLAFFRGRFTNLLVSQGYLVDLVEAVLAAQMDDLVDARSRMDALDTFRRRPEFEPLTVAFKRVANILKKTDFGEKADPSLFEAPQEEDLHRRYQEIEGKFSLSMAANEYEGALAQLAMLRAPVDAFFDHCMVMAEDERVRANRLALLGKIEGLFSQMADFSQVGGTDAK